MAGKVTIELAVLYRLQWSNHLRAQGLKADEHSAYTPLQARHLLPLSMWLLSVLVVKLNAHGQNNLQSVHNFCVNAKQNKFKFNKLLIHEINRQHRGK